MMDAYRIAVWLHWLFGIVLAGQALFWVIMLVALRRRYDETQTAQWLVVAKSARWPHVAVPYALRLPLPLVAWATLAVLVVSGLYLGVLTQQPSGAFWSAKLVLLAGIFILQAVLTWRPLGWAIVLNLLLTLAILVDSAWLVRG